MQQYNTSETNWGKLVLKTGHLIDIGDSKNPKPLRRNNINEKAERPMLHSVVTSTTNPTHTWGTESPANAINIKPRFHNIGADKLWQVVDSSSLLVAPAAWVVIVLIDGR